MGVLKLGKKSTHQIPLAFFLKMSVCDFENNKWEQTIEKVYTTWRHFLKSILDVVTNHNLKGIYNFVVLIWKYDLVVTNHNLKGIYNEAPHVVRALFVVTNHNLKGIYNL